MTYLAWAVMYEGESDASYFDVLIPRLMEDLALRGPRSPNIPAGPAIRLKRRSPEAVAQEVCDSQDAFFLVFIHADTGGRAQEASIAHRSTDYCAAMHELCGWTAERCIPVMPQHEMEAWVLADPAAILDVLGYRGAAADVGLPADALQAGRLTDPKAVLRDAVRQVRGPRRSVDLSQIYPAVAQRQNLNALRRSRSFLALEARVQAAMATLGAT